MTDPQVRIRWAARLPPRLLERLYDSDAKGFRDAELCDDVGTRLYERCRTFVLVSRSELDCPLCGTVFTVAPRRRSECPRAGCGWSTTQETYLESIRNHYAYTGRALDAFARFHARWPAARSYADRILLVDELIHSFHLDEATGDPVKSVASKLIAGNKNDVVRFLDRLSAVDADGKTRWRSTVSRTLHRRLVEPPEGGAG